MSEPRKPGLLDRLLGRKAQPAEDPPAARDLADVDPGPPETTPEWIEEELDGRHTADAPAAPPPTPSPSSGPPPHPEPSPSPAPPEATPEDLSPDPAPEPAPPEPQRAGWLQRLGAGLKRSSEQLSGNISAVFTKRKLDQATLEDLEDVLIQADLGMETATAITEALARDRFEKDIAAADVRRVLAAEVETVLAPVALPLEIDPGKSPFVILVVGVNGSGKTTTIGKLAQKLSREGRAVMLAAGDTFRAAAIEQLQIWGQRTGAPVVARPAGSDAAGLAFDALTEATAQGRDVLIIDTAGRLQNRDELMAELEKIVRVLRKVDATAPHAVLLTLDATTGQNALSQVEIFGRRAGVTGLVMTKLDGTARGGILVAIARRFGLPVHFIGVGEGVEDLEPFAAADFARAIAGDPGSGG